MTKNFVLSSNMTILGAPGSGKGFYGRLLTEAWRVPLYSASRILRQSNVALDLDSGRLVDDSTVARALLRFLQTRHCDIGATQNESVSSDANTSFVMDGFPRTRRQIDLMNETWPASLRITTAFRLQVPNEVCAQKIAGRRVCAVCQQEPNEAHVDTAGFILPPTRPSACQNQCRPERDWKRRLDDESSSIVMQRLNDYRHHEQPLVDYYATVNGLVSFTPYYGIKDAPQMRQSLEQWFFERDR